MASIRFYHYYQLRYPSLYVTEIYGWLKGFGKWLYVLPGTLLQTTLLLYSDNVAMGLNYVVVTLL